MWKLRGGSHILSLFHLPFNINLAGKEIYKLDEIASLSNGKVAVGVSSEINGRSPLPLPPLHPWELFLPLCSFVGVACVSLLPLSVCLQACTARHPSIQPVCQNQFTRTSLSQPVYKNQFIWINPSCFWFDLKTVFHFLFLFSRQISFQFFSNYFVFFNL